jgi:hypothetical protein
VVIQSRCIAARALKQHFDDIDWTVRAILQASRGRLCGDEQAHVLGEREPEQHSKLSCTEHMAPAAGRVFAAGDPTRG